MSMGGDYLVGYRIGLERASGAALSLALSEAAKELSRLGALIESWEYEDTSGLLLIHMRVGGSSLDRAIAVFERAIARRLKSPMRKARLSRSGQHYIEVKSVLPSMVTLGFLLRVAKLSRGYGSLSLTETLALLSYHLLRGDVERMLITLSFLGLHDDAEQALRSLEVRGLIDVERGALSEEAIKLLDELIPSLRVPAPSAEPMRLKVVKEDGDIEEFSADKLARSLYRAGIPHHVVSRVVPSILEALKGRKFISKRALVSMTCSLLEELEPAKASATRFTNYVYALERLYIRSGGGIRQLTWRLLRTISRKTLEERGLKPPPRLVKLHSELIAEDLRSRLSWTPWGTRACVIEERELARVAREVAPRISGAWAELSNSSVEELSHRYEQAAINTLLAALKSTDPGERKELIVEGLLELSSCLLMRLGLLPSNLLELNLGVLRYEIKRRASSTPEDGARWRRLKRLCSLSLRLAHSPAVTSPSEDVRIKAMLEEELKLMFKALPGKG